ncbi:MAG: lipopolysaccharide biosynthesis protein [Planctomycetaceae bacterium]
MTVPSSSYLSSEGILNEPPGSPAAQLLKRLKAVVSGRSQYLINIVSNAGGNSLNAVIQLLVLLLLARWLSTSAYASWLKAGVLIGFAEVASDFGIRWWAVRRMAADSSPQPAFAAAFIGKLLWTMLSILTLTVIPLGFLSTTELLLCVLVAATQPGTDPALWYLRSRERLDIEAVLLLAGRVLTAVLLIASARSQVSLTGLLAVWMICNVIRLLLTLSLPVCRPLLSVRSLPALSGVVVCLREAFPIGVSLLLAPLLTQAALTFVSLVGTDADVTEFGTAFKLVIAAGFVGTGIVVSSFAGMSRAARDEDRSAAAAHLRTMLLIMTGAVGTLCLAGILLSRPVAAWLLPERLAAAGGLMIALMPGLYLSCVNMAAKFALNAFDRNWSDVHCMLCGFAVFAMSCGLLSSLPLAIHAAVSWTVTEAAVLICRWIQLKRADRHHGFPAELVCGTFGLLAFSSWFLMEI